ncbi:RagB/SusD family nutrient uptake outer membrane protein [Chitinophaga varians]|uniref:RagB/SusD family nutrient uptake outer membrane protein n=1 Tax=Chitinophaga varians TaxID=2202339 RepID=UPI00165EFBD1|nr:RagB/SusD family nutrient uptake outer membrane protein [Chitinophaga varians]MBC9911740.1 RagB/SusD family nutrient uptake outer membrane protein [Chitinophaga varians]
MKRIHIITCLLCMTSILVISCKKVLELNPRETPSSGVYWQNENDALAGLLGGYSLLRDALTNENRYYVYGDVPCNTFLITYGSDYAIHQLRDGSFDGSYYGYLENLQDWTPFYKAIAQANLLIRKIPTIPTDAFKVQDRKNYFLGEAYYLRAFNYFFISKVWGDVPLVTDAVEDVSEAKNYGREAQQKVLAQAIADLEQAKKLLPVTTENTGDRGVRASLATALALEAHIYAWMGNYAKCEENTREIVNNPGKFNLTFITDSATYVKMTLGHSTESIFEININYNQNEGSKKGIGERTLYDPFLATRKPVNTDDVPWLVNMETIDKIYDRFSDDTTDLRFKVWYYALDGRWPMLRKYSSVIYKDGDIKRDPWFSNNILISRLSDIILLRAEALSKLGDEPGARLLVDKIRQRAGVTPTDPSLTGDDLFTFIVYERVRELYAEGQTYWDLCRTKKLGDFNDKLSGSFTPGNANYGRTYWPINRDIFKDNPLMKQTPYWNGRL